MVVTAPLPEVALLKSKYCWVARLTVIALPLETAVMLGIFGDTVVPDTAVATYAVVARLVELSPGDCVVAVFVPVNALFALSWAHAVKFASSCEPVAELTAANVLGTDIKFSYQGIPVQGVRDSY